MRILTIFALVLGMVAFVLPNAYGEEIKTFYIHSQLVDCVGVGPMKCMQVREDQTSRWGNFYDNIQGFEFVQGNTYTIQVKVTDVENPPADSSNKKYELVEILNQESTTKHFPYKNMCAPGFVPLGGICVLNDRCGPGAYAGKVCIMDGVKQPYLRPSKQGNSGISAENVICVEGMRLIFKSHDGSPACIKQQSASALEKRGWQTFMPVLACTLEYNPMCGTDGKTYGNKCMLESAHIGLKNEGECSIDISEINLDVTQKDLREMVDQWMNNTGENDRNQRLHIMMSYYAFEESGKKLTTDQDGLQLMNQIRKMISLDLPREELDQLRVEIREKLQNISEDQTPVQPIIKTGTYSGFCLGYCGKEFSITPEKIILTETGSELISDTWESLPVKTRETPLPKSEWNDLVKLVDFEKFNSIPDKIGCPGCADAPVEWIEISLGQKTKKVEFEKGDKIPEIEDLIKKLQEIRHILEDEMNEDSNQPVSTGVFVETLRFTSEPPQINEEKGYAVTEIASGVFWLVGSGYQTMFLTTGEGVVVFDAPKPIGENYLAAINEVTEEPITHMIYSHHHQDHTGAAGQIFPEDITYIAHQDAAAALEIDNDPNRPIPNMPLEGDFNTLEIGNKTIEFYNIGDFHSKGNWLIILPQSKVAMLVDLFRPAESPYRAFGVTPDIELYLETHDVLQEFDFEVLISGHTGLLATKKHVETNKMFTLDVKENAKFALNSKEPNPSETCSTVTIKQWEGRLGNLDAFMEDHCNAMIEYLNQN